MDRSNEELARYGVVVQARTSSSRLPGKVLMDVEGQPMLLRQLKRLRHGITVEKLVVATSDDPSDDPIEELCTAHGFDCFRGPLADVLQRYLLLGRKHGIDYLIRVGGDDPLIDPRCCNFLVELHGRNPCDFIYASNRSGWPYGCAAELISRAALEEIRGKTSDPLYLEHIVPYFFDHPEAYRMVKAEAPPEIVRPDYCFSVDYPEDMELVKTVFRRLSSRGEYFTMEQVIELVDVHPEIREINQGLHHGFDR